jgi:hypothetical protein
MKWSPSEFMSNTPTNVFLLVEQIDHGDAESFNQLQRNLGELNTLKVKDGFYLVFSHENHDTTSGRLFKGVKPGSNSILALISDTASMPK